MLESLTHYLVDWPTQRISAGNPFQETNKIILFPLHVRNNHWWGAVIDYRRESRGILLFDPLQGAKSKYYAKCETQLRNLLGELMQIKRITNSRQPDVSTYGTAVPCFLCAI
ncbi:Ulp1 protease family, C-terminal catalytic domain [Phytophthora cactorum]|nr:Ulp1 protease family, C-terminal catalytic domain [Phytophthora cactorum]